MKIELTTEGLQRFVGGEAEVIKVGECDRVLLNPWPPLDYRFRGQIASIEMRDGQMAIVFTWAAKNLGGGAEPSDEWEARSLGSRIAPYVPDPHFTVTVRGRILEVHGLILKETVVLYPPGTEALDPDKVEGFPRGYYDEQVARFRLTFNRPEGQ